MLLAVALDPPHRLVPVLPLARIARPRPELLGDVVGRVEADRFQPGPLALADQVLDHRDFGAGRVLSRRQPSSLGLQLRRRLAGHFVAQAQLLDLAAVLVADLAPGEARGRLTEVRVALGNRVEAGFVLGAPLLQGTPSSLVVGLGPDLGGKLARAGVQLLGEESARASSAAPGRGRRPGRRRVRPPRRCGRGPRRHRVTGANSIRSRSISGVA